MAKKHGNKVRVTILLDEIERDRLVKKAEARGDIGASAYVAQLLHNDGAYQYNLGYLWMTRHNPARLKQASPDDQKELIRVTALVEAGLHDAADFEAGMRRALLDSD